MEVRTNGFSQNVSGMNQTKGLTSLNGAQFKTLDQLKTLDQSGSTVQRSGFTRSEDEFVLSSEAQAVHATSMNPQPEATSAARLELIEQIKNEIANGTYDTDAKLESALERMLDGLLDHEV